MATAPLPQVYVDAVAEVPTSALAGQAITFCNRMPEHDELDVPTNAPIELTWIDLNEGGITSATITVESSVGPIVACTITGTTPTFNIAYSASSSYTRTTSVAGTSAIPNQCKLQLVRTTPWVSEERINVKAVVVPTVGSATTVIYSFYVEDITTPHLTEARTQGLTTLLVSFSESVAMHAEKNGALRVRSISGRITFTEPTTVEVERSGLSSDDVGSYVCFTGATQALNNGFFEIYAVNGSEPSAITTIEQTVRTEAPTLDQRGFITPYRLLPVMEANRLIPTYTPCVVDAEEYDERTVKLTLDQELSPGRTYQIQAKFVADAADPENVINSSSIAFTAETLPTVTGRQFDLWGMLPAINRREDVSGDTERFIRCFDEIAQLLLRDIDNFENLLDFETTPEEFVDGLLLHLGCPYTFLRDETEKRKVLATLVQSYKDSGLERSIEDAVQKIMGITVNVFPLNVPDVFWSLGESELGVDTILGTDDTFLKYSFEIIVYEQRDVVIAGTTNINVRLQTGGLPKDRFVGRTIRIGNEDRTILSNTENAVTVSIPFPSVPPTGSIATILGLLTDEERSIITEIANIWKPAHTHFVRFIESGTPIPTF